MSCQHITPPKYRILICNLQHSFILKVSFAKAHLAICALSHQSPDYSVVAPVSRYASNFPSGVLSLPYPITATTRILAVDFPRTIFAFSGGLVTTAKKDAYHFNDLRYFHFQCYRTRFVSQLLFYFTLFHFICQGSIYNKIEVLWYL